MAIGRKIGALRERLGLTQTQLAERVGIKPQTLQALESRDSERSKHFLTIAAAMGVTMEQLRDWPLDALHRQATGAAPEASAKEIQAREPDFHLYSATPDRQGLLLRLFDELTPAQQDSVLKEIQALVEANRTVVQHYSKRVLRTTEDGRVETSFGSPGRGRQES